MNSSFKAWEKRRRQLAPEAENTFPLVAAAGRSGMTRKQLGNAIELDQEVLNELLSGMVEIGLLAVIWRDGMPVYRAGVRGIRLLSTLKVARLIVALAVEADKKHRPRRVRCGGCGWSPFTCSFLAALAPKPVARMPSARSQRQYHRSGSDDRADGTLLPYLN